MSRWWLILVAVAIALAWWSVDYLWPQITWMLDRCAQCALLGMCAALLADRVLEEPDA